jgi:hypothetical protein
MPHAPTFITSTSRLQTAEGHMWNVTLKYEDYEDVCVQGCVAVWLPNVSEEPDAVVFMVPSGNIQNSRQFNIILLRNA